MVLMAKNPILAAFLSFLLPGMGQIYVGKILFGLLLILLAFIISTLAIFLISIIGIILYIILWLYAIYDAYTSVQETSEDVKSTDA
jgi:TM2 domain-containing membrane protein YozV